MVKAWYCNT